MNYMLLTQYQGKIVGPIAWLLGHIMDWIFSALNALGIPNTVLAIFLFTLIMYIFLLPLTFKQQKFSKLQAKMSPELQQIQAKYKGKKDNDSMLAQQEEIKALYAKYGVSQAGSCLQILIQFPIMIALFRIISSMPAYVSIVREAFNPLVSQLRETTGSSDFIQTLSSAKQFSSQFSSEAFTSGDVATVENTFVDVLNKASSADWDTLLAKFGSLSDSITHTRSLLDSYNNLFGMNIGNSPSFMFKNAIESRSFVLLIVALAIPLLSAFTQWVNIKLMPQAANASNDPNDQAAQMANSMKTMNTMMPLMSIIFTFTVPCGIGIYWISGSIVRTIQQIFINKYIDKMDIDAQIAKNEEKYKKRLEAMKQTPQMNRYANMTTKNLSSSSSKLTQAEKDAGIKKASDIYSGGNVKKGSLLSRANMVKEFDEKNNKQGES